MTLKPRKGIRTNLPVMAMDDESDPWPGMFGDVAGGGGSVLIDSWPSENQNDIQESAFRAYNDAVAQSFVATQSCKLHSVKFVMKQNAGTDQVQIAAQLWAADSATLASARPTGTPLATSAAMDSLTLPVTPEFSLIEFLFDDTFQIEAGTVYCIGAENLNDLLNTGRVCFGEDINAGAGHAGVYSERNQLGIWTGSVMGNADMVFYLYGTPQ